MIPRRDVRVMGSSLASILVLSDHAAMDVILPAMEITISECTDAAEPFFPEVERCAPCGAEVKKRGQICRRCQKIRTR